MNWLQNHSWLLIVSAVVLFSIGFYCGKVEQKASSADITNQSTLWEEEEIVIQNRFYITGEISHPGLYEFQENICLMDAIDMAGGLTEKADITEVNPARSIRDGEKITIPSSETEHSTAGLPSSVTPKKSNGNKININLASLDELMTLPNIGRTRAEDILVYREKNGSFITVDEIMNVSGIGQKTFDALKDLICVDGSG